MVSEIRVIVHVDSADAPARREPDATEDLRRDLARLEAVHISPPNLPQTRAIDPAAVGQIVVTLTGLAGGLGAVIETIRGWLRTRSAARKVRLEIDGDVLEVSGLDDEGQRLLIEGWLERHRAPA